MEVLICMKMGIMAGNEEHEASKIRVSKNIIYLKYLFLWYSITLKLILFNYI